MFTIVINVFPKLTKSSGKCWSIFVTKCRKICWLSITIPAFLIRSARQFSRNFLKSFFIFFFGTFIGYRMLSVTICIRKQFIKFIGNECFGRKKWLNLTKNVTKNVLTIFLILRLTRKRIHNPIFFGKMC